MADKRSNRAASIGCLLLMAAFVTPAMIALFCILLKLAVESVRMLFQ